MSEPIKVVCPNCDAVLTLKDDSKVGRRVPCPKCSEPFVIRLPDEEDDDWDEEDVDSVEETSAGHRRSSSSSQGGAGSRTKRPSKPQNSISMNTIVLGGGIAAGLVLVMGVAIAVGLRASGKQGAAANQAAMPVPAPAVNQASIADADFEQLGNQMQSALMSKQIAQVSALFDWNVFASRSATGLGMTPAELSGFATGITRSAENPAGLIGSMTSRIGSGSAKYVRVIQRPDGKRILVRLIFEDGTSNYMEWVPAKNAAGQLKIVDGYSYLSGELFSATIRRLIIPSMASLQPNLINKLSGAERESAQYMQQLQKMTAAVRSNQPQQVLTFYAQLPESLKKEKACLLQRLNASQQIGDDEYLKSLEDFQKYFPGDPALDFIRLDYWAMKKDFPAAVEGIKRLETAMGGIDGHLHGLLAIELYESGKLQDARDAAAEAIGVEPELGTPYQAIVMVDLKEQKFDDALKNMKLLFEKSQQEFLDMETNPEFADFLKSTQHEEWLAYRREKG